jgi:phosphate transport system ATP-binding protein
MEFVATGADRASPGAGPGIPAPAVRVRQGTVSGAAKVAARDINVFYGDKQALFDVSLDIPDRSVTA